MAKSKQYKNVYTILEKVKKGEIDSYYKNKDGLFGKINFYKKEDLIKPYMHYIDEDKLKNIVDTYVDNSKNTSDYYNRFKTNSRFKAMPEDKKPDLNKFHQTVKDKYNAIPKHLKNDIFKLYYNKMDKMKFEERTDVNLTRYKFLEKGNNPVGKIMTETSNLKSSIFTRNIMMYYAARLAMLEYIDPDAADKMQKGMEGGDDFNNQDMDSLLEDFFNDRQGKNMMDDALNNATETCKMLDQAFDKDTQEKMFEESTKFKGNKAGDLSPDYIRTVAANLEKITMSMSALKDKIKKMLDKSTSYFSSRQEVIYEDFLNATDLSGIEDIELLHPKLRKLYLEDIRVKDVKKIGKLNIYIDISGSMSGGISNESGRNISKLDFCKAFAIKLAELDMLNQVFIFNNSVKQFKSDKHSLAMLDCNGGTSINAVINHIERNSENAIVITDAEDGCHYYTNKAFFIGVAGCNFRHFQKDVIKQYTETGQMIIFEGSRVLSVDPNGMPIRR